MNNETGKRPHQSQANPIPALCNPSNPNQRQSTTISPPIKPSPRQSTCIKGQISLSHSVKIKSAELWLKLGEADEAVRELEALPSRSWNHLWAVRVRVAALQVLGERILA
jgi:hypothetical protein